MRWSDCEGLNKWSTQLGMCINWSVDGSKKQAKIETINVNVNKSKLIAVQLKNDWWWLPKSMLF